MQMPEELIDLLKGHSLHYIEMGLRMDRHRRPEQYDGYGKRVGDCKDTIEVFIVVKEDIVHSVWFEVQGCMNTVACANTVAHLVEGKNVGEAWEVSPEAVAEFLETLPTDHFHCAELAVGAFYLALTNYQELKRNSWKKLYQ